MLSTIIHGWPQYTIIAATCAAHYRATKKLHKKIQKNTVTMLNVAANILTGKPAAAAPHE